MPNKPNTKKALRQSVKRRKLNDERRVAYKKALKNTIKAEDKGEKSKLAVVAQKALDKAVKKGVIKKKTASRKLSRLMKKINAVDKKTK
jgi:small subunit ribosomal protein S20